MRGALALALALLGGCDDTASGDDDPDAAAPEPDAVVPGDRWVAGLEKTGADGVLRARLLDAVPAPPERGDNRWVVEVRDAAGDPRADCTFTIRPFMPEHGHGSTTPVDVSAGDAPGRYVLDPVNFFMPGLWETTLGLTCGGASDAVVYTFWIEG